MGRGWGWCSEPHMGQGSPGRRAFTYSERALSTWSLSRFFCASSRREISFSLAFPISSHSSSPFLSFSFTNSNQDWVGSLESPRPGVWTFLNVRSDIFYFIFQGLLDLLILLVQGLQLRKFCLIFVDGFYLIILLCEFFKFGDIFFLIFLCLF
jgi:hypothetical protein